MIVRLLISLRLPHFWGIQITMLFLLSLQISLSAQLTLCADEISFLWIYKKNTNLLLFVRSF